MIGRLLILGVLDVETNFRVRIDSCFPLNASLGRPLRRLLFDVNAQDCLSLSYSSQTRTQQGDGTRVRVVSCVDLFLFLVYWSCRANHMDNGQRKRQAVCFPIVWREPRFIRLLRPSINHRLSSCLLTTTVSTARYCSTIHISHAHQKKYPTQSRETIDDQNKGMSKVSLDDVAWSTGDGRGVGERMPMVKGNVKLTSV